MKRDFKRIYREHGLKFFALPVAVVLVIAVIMDHQLAGYPEMRREVAELSSLVELNQQILDSNSRVEERSKTLDPQYAQAVREVFSTAAPEHSLQEMQGKLRQILQSLYFENIELVDPMENRGAGTTRISVTARFNGVPQQLPRLQSALLQNPQFLAVESLELAVVPDPARGGQQMAITARFTGIHTNKILPPPAAAPGAKL